MAAARSGVVAGEAFDDWVAPHLPILRAVAVREVGPSESLDLVQDTLIRAWKRRSTFDIERGSVKTWLVAILLGQARRRRIRARPFDTVRDRAGLAARDAVTATGEARLDVEQAVRVLPRRQREVVTLFYLADLSVTEVASVLGIAEGSVKAHLSAARASLRDRLEPT